MGDVLNRLLAVLLLVCCGVVATGAPASACPRTQTSAAQQVRSADAVFTGKVADRARQGSGIHYTVDVTKIYKGDVSEHAALVTAQSARACGEPDLRLGTEYLFVAVQDGGDLRLEQDSAAPATHARVARVEQLLGPGTAPTPPVPPQATFTLVAGERTSLARLAAPGVALVIVGLLGLLLAMGLSRRRS